MTRLLKISIASVPYLIGQLAMKSGHSGKAAEQDREIRRPHAHRGPHLVINGGPDDKEQAEAEKHQARPEVFRTLDFHCFLPSLLRRQSVTCAPPQPSCARCQLFASLCSHCCPCS